MSVHETKETKEPITNAGNGSLSRRDFLLKLSLGLNVVAGAMVAIPLIGYVMSVFVKKLPLQWTPLGELEKFPEGTHAAGYIRKSFSSPLGWRSGGNSLLGAPRRCGKFPGFRDQLHSSRLSRALV